MRLLVSMLCLLLPLCAQQPPGGGKGGGKKGPPKNLKVLKVPPTNLRETMHSFTVALNVKCEHCHVGMQDLASDENPKKNIARKMIVMTQEINARFPDSKEHVTCFTCHRG